jgi:MerR family mercuric resistance operon transcriptional regulator
MRQMTIGAVAKACGVGVETVRYYQRRGLLAETPNCHGARTLAAQKLEIVKARLRDLQRVRRALTELIERCDAGREHHCPMIESLARGA